MQHFTSMPFTMPASFEAGIANFDDQPEHLASYRVVAAPNHDSPLKHTNSRRGRSPRQLLRSKSQYQHKSHSPMRGNSRRASSADMVSLGRSGICSESSQYGSNRVIVTAKPVEEHQIRKKRSTSVGVGFFRRLSSVMTKTMAASTVYFNGKEMGHMVVRGQESVAKVRLSVLKEIEELANEEFYFWYTEKKCRLVELEDETTTKISACVDQNDRILHLRTRMFMKNNQNISDFLFTDTQLRDLAPEAESVIRCCFRILEDIMMPKSMKNADANLPNQALNCIPFIKNVAWAAVDSRRTKANPSLPNINWKELQHYLRELEDLVREYLKRDGFALWWFYKTDRKAYKHVIANIQREFHESPNLRDDHPVFSVQFKRASSQTEALVATLDKIEWQDFLSKKHEKTRMKIATFLNMTEEELCHLLLTKKDQILFSSRTPQHTPLHEQNAKAHANKAIEELLQGKGGLKSILDPLYQFQESVVTQKAADFRDGTRHWTTEAFDTFLASTDKSQRAFILTGPSCSGKTCLFAKTIETRREKILGFHFCRHDDFRFRDAKSMLLSMTYQLTLQSPYYASRVRSIITENGLTRKKLQSDDCSIGMIFATLLEAPLSEIPVPPNERYVILIDGLDEAKCDDTGKNDILDAISDFFLHLPTWILFAFSTTPELNILKKLRRFNAVMVEPNSNDDYVDLVACFTSALAFNTFVVNPHTNLLQSTLADHADGNFLYANIITKKFAEYGTNSDYLRECMKHDLEGLLMLEHDTVVGHLDVQDDSLFWKVVKLAMVAMKPMHKDVVCVLAGCNVDDLGELLRLGTIFFTERNSRVRFRHKCVKDWLLERLGEILVSSMGFQSQSKRRLSFSGFSHMDCLEIENSISSKFAYCHKFFAERILDVTRHHNGSDRFKYNTDMTSKYVLQYGVHHLSFANKIEEARNTVLDPAWLIARAADPEGIIECCGLVGKGDRVLHLFERAVSMSIKSIRADPRQLIGQLVGRLLAVTVREYEEQDVRAKLTQVVHDMKSYDYGFQWWCPLGPTWHQVAEPFLRMFVGHTSPVQSVAWHSVCQRCASASWDGTIRVWDSLTGKEEQLFRGHTDSVFSVHWETNGNRIVSGSLDKSIKVWNTETKNCEATLVGHLDSVWCVQWSKDSKRIASGSKDKTARIWCSTSGKELCSLSGHEGSVYSVAWEGGMNSRLCTGGTENTIRIWDTKTAFCLQRLDGHKDWIREVFWGQCGTILSASADHTIRVWVVADGMVTTCKRVLVGHSDCCWSVSMSADSRYAVSGSTDGTVKVWNLESGICEQTLSNHSGPVWCVTWGPDGKRVLSGSSDKSVILWDATIGLPEKPRVAGHGRPIWSVDVSSDGNTIVTGSSDNTARLWNTESGQCYSVLTGHDGPVYTVRLSNQSRKVATGSSDSTAAIYNIDTGERILVLSGHTYGVWSVAWTVNDRKVFTGSKDRTIRMWCSITGLSERIFEGHTDTVKSLSVSSDGRRLASASPDKTLRVWNLVTGECDAVLQRKEAGALCVEWNPDNIRVVAGYSSGCVRVWNVDTGEREIGFLPGHSRRVTTVAWSPNGERIVSSSTDKEIRVWDKVRHQCELKIKGHDGLGIFGIKWAKSGTIVSVGTDRTIRIWNPETGTCLKVLSEYCEGLGVFAVAWSPDGTKVVTGSRDRTVKIYDAQTGKCDAVFNCHTAWVTKVGWTDGGKRVVSGSDDGTTRIWELSGECVLVKKSSPDDFQVQNEEWTTQDLSGLAKEYEPVGIHCERVQVRGKRAVGWVCQSVYFFELLGQEDIFRPLERSRKLDPRTCVSLHSNDAYQARHSLNSEPTRYAHKSIVVPLKGSVKPSETKNSQGRNRSSFAQTLSYDINSVKRRSRSNDGPTGVLRRVPSHDSQRLP